ncbi:MAG: hypothetical protein ABSA83_08585 [Verrucomicrobiota bacterium]|jgi:hypothetical protein
MKMKNLILGALLLVLAAGCNKESDNANVNGNATTPATNAPVVTNSPATTN